MVKKQEMPSESRRSLTSIDCSRADAYDQFGRVNLFESNYYEEAYDYYSIMHYDRKSFSKNGQDTMVAKQPGALT